MTTKKGGALRAAVRERQSFTGESYNTALRRIRALWDAQDAALGDLPKPKATERPVLSREEFEQARQEVGSGAR